jgi:hypothetical protein
MLKKYKTKQNTTAARRKIRVANLPQGAKTTAPMHKYREKCSAQKDGRAMMPHPFITVSGGGRGERAIL